jgi:hypothetical protein
MITARLWIDAAHVRWALVQCGICGDIHRYTLDQAANEILACKKCANAVDARAQLAIQMAEVDDEPPMALPSSSQGKAKRAFER